MYSNMRKTFICLSALFILLTCGCRPGISQDEIYQTWIHSFEEDTPDIMMFRPSTYPFPPARGREGFTVASDGSFVWHAIAPTDGTTNRKGTWRRTEPTKLEVKLNESGQTFTLDIQAHDAQRLQIFRNSFPNN